MDNICRTCLLYNIEESDEIKMVSIFKSSGEATVEQSLKKVLETTVPQLNIKENDELPKNVCKKCFDKIIDIYGFQLMCLKNEEKFHKLLELGDISDLFNKSNHTEKLMIETDIEQDFMNQFNCIELCHEEVVEKDFIIDDEHNSVSDSADVLRCDDNNESSCKLNNCKEDKPRNSRNKSLKKNIKRNASRRTTNSKRTNSKELFSCDKCQRKLKSKLSLMKHHEMHLKKDKEERDLKCNICKQDFSDIKLFKNHQQTHTSEKSFLCSQCGKGFISAGSLKQHSFRHLEKKLYPCSYCPKSFPTNGDLLCHYEIHKAKPRIHVCDVCGRGFYKQFLLKQHQRYHNNERPFACEYCEKRFVTSEKQRRHMRTHTGEKPYRCKYCDRAFAQSNDCIKHLRQHLGDNVYQCELCPLRFPLARDLRSHFASHKDDDEETRSQNLKARMKAEQDLQIK